MRVRIRGVHATALTAHLADDHAIVQASPTIERRFGPDDAVADHAATDDAGTDEGSVTGADATGTGAGEPPFAAGPADAWISDAAGRLGVGITGESDAVDRLDDAVTGIAVDAQSSTDPAPADAVVLGRVTDTRSGGAIVDIGGTEGFLPSRAVEDAIETDDWVVAQVHDPAAPWADSRPGLGTDLHVATPAATFVRSTVTGATDPVTDLVGETAPDGWHVGQRSEVPIDTLRAAGDRAATAAERIESVLADVGVGPGVIPAPDRSPGPLVRPWDGRWVRFGHDARSALDDRRREVTPTVTGHHRLKAAGVGNAIDLVERVCGSTDAFPFDAVTDALGPSIGDDVRIEHGKPDGDDVDLGPATVVDVGDGTLTLEREMRSSGVYDGIGTAREPGDVATTTIRDGRWWVVSDRLQGSGRRIAGDVRQRLHAGRVRTGRGSLSGPVRRRRQAAGRDRRAGGRRRTGRGRRRR